MLSGLSEAVVDLILPVVIGTVPLKHFIMPGLHSKCHTVIICLYVYQTPIIFCLLKNPIHPHADCYIILFAHFTTLVMFKRIQNFTKEGLGGNSVY